jgi:hypothetical protein
VGQGETVLDVGAVGAGRRGSHRPRIRRDGGQLRPQPAGRADRAHPGDRAGLIPLQIPEERLRPAAECRSERTDRSGRSRSCRKPLSSRASLVRPGRGRTGSCRSEGRRCPPHAPTRPASRQWAPGLRPGRRTGWPGRQAAAAARRRRSRRPGAGRRRRANRG